MRRRALGVAALSLAISIGLVDGASGQAPRSQPWHSSARMELPLRRGAGAAAMGGAVRRHYCRRWVVGGHESRGTDDNLTKPQVYVEYKNTDVTADRLAASDSLLTGQTTPFSTKVSALGFVKYRGAARSSHVRRIDASPVPRLRGVLLARPAAHLPGIRSTP